MFRTMEEIYENEYLRALVRDCRRYNMIGVFVEHNLHIESKESGIYFVTGIDHEKIKSIINDDSFNPAKELIKQELNSRKYHPVRVFKVTNENPSMVSYEVRTYCWQSEFVNNIFPKYNIKNIDKIPAYTIYYLASLYRKTHSKQYNGFMRFQYKVLFDKRMLNLQKVQNKKGLAGKYRDYEFSPIFNDKENILMNFIKFFFRNRQKTSLIHLQREYGQTKSMLIEKDMYRKFKKELKKYPEILYSVDRRIAYKEFSNKKIREDTYNFEKVYKPKKEKVCKCKRITFAEEAVPIISTIVNIIEKVPYAPMTAEDIVNSGKEWDALVLNNQEFLDYEIKFKNNNILYAIDTGYANHPDYNHIPILFFKEDRELIELIIRDVVDSGSTYHAIRNSDAIVEAGIAKLYYNYNLPKKPSEIKKEQEELGKDPDNPDKRVLYINEQYEMTR